MIDAKHLQVRKTLLEMSKLQTQLALGMTLEKATLAGRNALFQADEADWANYLLFGGGSFRLVTPA